MAKFITQKQYEELEDACTFDWGLVFDTLLLIAFLQSDAETPEAAAEKFAKKLLDIPENVDLFAETPEERRVRSDKWYAQEWEKIKQEIEEKSDSEGKA